MSVRLTLPFVAALSALSALTACRRHVGPSSEAPRPVGAVTGATHDTVWYVSIRRDDGGQDTRQLADTLQYGLAIYRHRVANPRSGAVADPVLTDSLPLSATQFHAALAARLASSPADVPAIVYVHGFGTSRREAWHHTATAQALAGSAAPWIVFCWPSNGLGVSWPSRTRPVTRAYRDDSVRAQASRPAFAETLVALAGTVGGDRLVVASHSMGAQIVAETLADPPASLAEAITATPLRAAAFLTPDIAAARFADTLITAVRARVDRAVLYVSSRDRVLRVARWIHASDRAGLASVPPLVRETFETIDISAAATGEGWLQRHFGNHHSIRYAAGAIADIARIVAPRLPAACRIDFGTGERTDDGVWHLRNAPPSASPISDPCTRALPAREW